MTDEDGHASSPNRREFLAHVGGAAATVAGVASLATNAAAQGRENGHDESRSQRRANQAFQVRLQAALFQRENGAVSHPINGDERRYPNRIGSFSKTLPHDANGEVDPAAFDALVHAMSTADPDDFERIPMGGAAKLANPQSGFAFGFCGADTHATTVPAAPRFASAETAAEMVELYWAALTRDVPFDMFEGDATIAAAAAELSSMSNFRGPKKGGIVTPATIFRGPTAGDLVGPYISQLLWKPINYGRTQSTRGCASRPRMSISSPTTTSGSPFRTAVHPRGLSSSSERGGDTSSPGGTSRSGCIETSAIRAGRTPCSSFSRPA